MVRRVSKLPDRLLSGLRFFLALLIVEVLAATSASAQAPLRGHGGPVRAVAISNDGQSALSGSFDTSAIRWSLTRDAAEQCCVSMLTP